MVSNECMALEAKYAGIVMRNMPNGFSFCKIMNKKLELSKQTYTYTRYTLYQNLFCRLNNRNMRDRERKKFCIKSNKNSE